MNPTTSDTITNWSPHLQLQNPKLNLSNFTATSPLNKGKNILWNKQIKPKNSKDK